MSLTPFFLGIDPLFNHHHHGRRGGRTENPNSLSALLSEMKPAIDLHEENDTFIVEAEVPGVKREDIDVHVGDHGKSVTISGRTFARRSWRSGDAQQPNESEGTAAGHPSGASSGAQAQEVAKRAEGTVSNTISSERSFVGSSTFTRTVWLPRAVDGSKVTAQLQDGILMLRLPKQQDREAVRVSIQ